MSERDSFASIVRQFLRRNPLVLSMMVEVIHQVANDLESLNTHSLASLSPVATPQQLKNKVGVMVLEHLGYSDLQIVTECAAGRERTIIQNVSGLLERATNQPPPSRRALPPPSRPDL